MGFSPIIGGGTTTAHTHTNAASDGGALNSSTIINTNPLLGLMIALG